MLQQFLNNVEEASAIQHQIVNEQEQNREVNAGTLTQPDEEKVTDGSMGEVSDSAVKKHSATEESGLSPEEQEGKSQENK